MGPRWKGKGSEAKALADPMSKIMSQFQSSLFQSNSIGLLSGNSVLIGVEDEQIDLLNRACFARPIITTEKDKQWFQLGMEEAFYLCHPLKCLRIVGNDNCPKTDEELWQYMKSKRETFPDFYKAYSHLRMKNWVVRSGAQYGVDFVAYRHHPALVHSEYAVLVLSEWDNDANGRLRVWSDFHCTIRLCGSVAKTLLVLHINRNGHGADSPLCLERYTIEERTITGWSPKQCREDQIIGVWTSLCASRLIPEALTLMISKAPSWLTTFAPANALIMQEEAWNAYPRCKTVIKCPYFTKFLLTIDTIHKADNGKSENVHDLSKEQLAARQVEIIDIASAASDYWSYVVGSSSVDFSKFRSVRTGRGPLLEG